MLYLLFEDLDLSFNITIAICIGVCVLIPYVIGSLNFGIIFSQKLFKQDVRASGSGNAGATNMLRTYGKKAGALTFLCDALKTCASMSVTYLVMPDRDTDWIWVEVGMFIAGICCMIGHTYPIFFKFKGGKGVACFAIVVLMTSIKMGMWFLFPILFVCFAIIVIGTKFVSLGSVICSLMYPIIINRLVSSMQGGEHPYKMLEIFAVFAGLFVVFQHRENIKRLLNGTEHKISLSKKKEEPSEGKGK